MNSCQNETEVIFPPIYYIYIYVYIYIYIYIYIIFVIVLGQSQIYNLADDNALYSCTANLETVLENLEHDASKLLHWFEISRPGKVLIRGTHLKRHQPHKLRINTFIAVESDELELLGLTVYEELNFSKHVDKSS